jgi:YidC/Oxa1 family membrane protein insertase
MDKRTMITLALAAGVIILFQLFVFAPAEREAARKAQEARALIERAREDSLRLASTATAEGVPASPGLAAARSDERGAPVVPGTGTAGQAVPGAQAASVGVPQAQAGPPGRPVALVGGLTSNFVTPSPPPPAEIKVETSVYEVTFLSQGALLKSVRLKQFKTHGDSLVDLVRTPTAGEVASGVTGGESGWGEIGLVISSGRDKIDLSGAVFAVTDSVDAETGQVRKLVFVASTQTGARITKIYTFAEGSYQIGLDIELHGVSSQFEKVDCLLGWRNGLPLTETNQKEEVRNMATVSLLGTEFIKDDLNSFKKTALKEHAGNVKWSGVRSRYFIAAFVPPEGAVSKVLSFGDPAQSTSGCELVLPVSASGVTQISLTLYLGPIDLWRLKELDVGLERVVNMGWSWIRPVSQLVLWFLVKCHAVIPNYGIVVIILSALTKILFHPLTKSSMKSMRNMQKLQPEIQKIREKYKGDAQRMNKEVMGLYKKEKINPLGGCLPLLLQMPVFIALYNVLMSSIEMRRAHFVWWINDLSSPDTVAVISGFAIHLLPILMAVTMFVQQKMTPTDPRQAAMTYFMPILMLVFFYSLPSGLVLYWTANNAMTIGQQYLMQRGEKKPTPEHPAEPAKPPRKRAR